MRGGAREGAGRPKGAKNQRTVAVEQAMQVMAEKLKQVVPDAFEGDGVAYLQTVYRDPHQPTELRMDAAAKILPDQQRRRCEVGAGASGP